MRIEWIEIQLKWIQWVSLSSSYCCCAILLFWQSVFFLCLSSQFVLGFVFVHHSFPLNLRASVHNFEIFGIWIKRCIPLQFQINSKGTQNYRIHNEHRKKNCYLLRRLNMNRFALQRTVSGMALFFHRSFRCVNISHHLISLQKLRAYFWRKDHTTFFSPFLSKMCGAQKKSLDQSN